MAMMMSVLGKTIEQLKGHIQPGTKGLTLIKVRFLPSSSLPLPSPCSPHLPLAARRYWSLIFTRIPRIVQGVDVKNDKIQIYADLIEKELGISCSSLSGANIANEGEHEFESGI
jgi:hypothetical protein